MAAGAGPEGPADWARAHDVFLQGSGLLDGPAAPWAQASSWHVLDSHFGLGLKFLATWHAWRTCAVRPARLHYSALLATPVHIGASDLGRGVQDRTHLQTLVNALAPHWFGLLDGTHRIVLEGGQVLLTLHIGRPDAILPTLDAAVDGVFLDTKVLHKPADKAGLAPKAKALGRLCRRGARLVAAPDLSALPALLQALRSAGFELGAAACAAQGPQGQGLCAVYAPGWPSAVVTRSPLTPRPGRVVVVGGGLAGSAAAYSLAQRGWSVDVLDAAAAPAAGASALPVGIVAPHVSADDAKLSRLSRAGVRLTLQRAQTLLHAGSDWALSGSLEHRVEGRRGLPVTESWQRWGGDWSLLATAEQQAACGLGGRNPLDTLWHCHAGWIRPAQLVRAQLAHPGIHWRGGAAVQGLRPGTAGWDILGPDQQILAQSAWVVLAAGWPTRGLLESTGQRHLPAHPLRGQVSWGALGLLDEATRGSLPPFPVHGHGALVHGIPGPDGQAAWVVGSTFERAMPQALIRPQDRTANLHKLHGLLPRTAARLAPHFKLAHDWAGVRCTLPDRMPAVGLLNPHDAPGLAVCTGLGARGLSLSVLCGEWLAAALHGEPWPMERPLAQALAAGRFLRQR